MYLIFPISADDILPFHDIIYDLKLQTDLVSILNTTEDARAESSCVERREMAQGAGNYNKSP